MMAFLSDIEVEDIVNRYGLPKFTDKTITNIKKLTDELKNSRNKKYAESYEEYGKDAAAIAFPLFNAQRKNYRFTIHSKYYQQNNR